MSKSSIEHDIDQAIDYLDDIDRARRNNDAVKLKKLAGDADDFGRKLKHARDELHRDWDD